MTVARGDTLGKIAAARKPANATLEQTIVAIYQANRSQITDPDMIYPGQVFVVPSIVQN